MKTLYQMIAVAAVVAVLTLSMNAYVGVCACPATTTLCPAMACAQCTSCAIITTPPCVWHPYSCHVFNPSATPSPLVQSHDA